jgi:hypothetical protein
VTELGGSIDELELDLLQSKTTSLRNEGLSQSDGSLLGTSNTTLEHQEVFSDHTVVRESTDGVDGLLGQVEFSGTSVVTTGLTNAVDLLVDDGTVVVTVLTSAGH